MCFSEFESVVLGFVLFLFGFLVWVFVLNMKK